MTTINLYQNQAERESQLSAKSVNGGFFFSLGILILTLLLLLGVKIYVPMAQAEIEELDGEIASENTKLVGLKDLESIIDNQKRITEIKNNLKIVNGKVSKIEMSNVIAMIAGEMNNKVFVSSFKYDKDKTINLDLSTGNFNDASMQIFNFKKSDRFKDVVLSSLSRKEAAVSFSVKMKVNEADVKIDK